MVSSITLAVPHSVILVSGLNGGEVPTSMGHSVIASTETCIAVGCRSETDGETNIVLAKSGELSDLSKPYFQKKINLGSECIFVKSVFGDVLLDAKTEGRMPTISIWVNDVSEPDKIIIEVE